MAYHYLANKETAEHKTVRTETLHLYTGDNAAYAGWVAFDTPEERAARGPRMSWVVTVDHGAITPVAPGSIAAYKRAVKADADAGNPPRYVIYETEAEARANVPVMMFAVRISDGARSKMSPRTIEIHTTQGSIGQYRLFETDEQARAFHLTLYKWVLTLSSGEVSQVSPGDVAEYTRERNRAAYRVFDTEAEARAALPPRYIWDRNTRTYKPWTRDMMRRQDIFRPVVSDFTAVRSMIRAARDGMGNFTTGPGVNSNAFTQARELLARVERRRLLGPTGRRNQRARVVERLNALLAAAGNDRARFCICPDCQSVGDPFTSREVSGGGVVCQECASNYRQCAECETWHLSENMVTHNDDDGDEQDYCQDHIPDGYSGEREQEHSGELMAYSTDVLKHRSGFKLGQGEKATPLWLGWELEVYPKEGTDIYAAIKGVRGLSNSFAICKSDGSVRAGFEIVSVPGSLAWHRETVMPFLLKSAPLIEGWRHQDCGMHVHIGKDEISELTLGKLVVFMHEPENQGFITALAGRDVNNYSKRGQKKTLPAYRLEDTIGRYQALNFATRGRKTIEFRIFRSNVSPAGFMKNLEFCHAAVQWCKLASPFEIASAPSGVRMDEKQLDAITRTGYSNFIGWVARHCGDYPHLFKWLQENGYLTSKKALTSPSIAA